MTFSSPEAAALYREGKLERFRGHTASAISIFRRVSELSPESPRPGYQIGICLVESGDLAEGFAYLDRAVASDPSLTPHVVARKGVALCKRGCYAEAADLLQQAVRLEEENGTLRVWLGDALWGAGDRERALDSYRRATEIDPENENHDWRHGKLGEALQASGRHEEAEAAIERAREYRRAHERYLRAAHRVAACVQRRAARVEG